MKMIMKTVKILAAGAMLALFATACSKSANTTETATEETTAATAEINANGEVAVLTDDALFRPDKAIGTYVVLDFNAVWCGPCKRLNEPMEDAAKTYQGKVAFYSVDFEKLPETAKAFDITNVPVVIMLTPEGKVTRYDNLSPFISEEELKALTGEDGKEKVTQKIYESICSYINTMMQ